MAWAQKLQDRCVECLWMNKTEISYIICKYIYNIYISISIYTYTLYLYIHISFDMCQCLLTYCHLDMLICIDMWDIENGRCVSWRAWCSSGIHNWHHSLKVPHRCGVQWVKPSLRVFFFRSLQKFMRLGWLEGEDVDYQWLYTGRCFFGMKLMMEWLYKVWRVLGVSHITVFNGLPNPTTGMPTLWRKTMVPIGQYSSLMCCRPMGGKMLVKVVFTMLIFWTWSLICMHMAALTPMHKRDRWFLHLA